MFGRSLNPFTVFLGYPLYHFTVFLDYWPVCSGSSLNPFTVFLGYPLYHFTVYLDYRPVCSGSLVCFRGTPYTIYGVFGLQACVFWYLTEPLYCVFGVPLIPFTVFLDYRPVCSGS